MSPEATSVKEIPQNINLFSAPISEIRENPVALRTVDKTSEKFIGLVESIREKGFFGAITVRKQIDAETSQQYYELIDGLHRYSAAKEAGITHINVNVVDFDKDQVLETQIMANIHKIESKPVEYSRQLKRILTRNPYMTEAELAKKLALSPQWVKDRLGLNKITDPKIADMIDSGKIALTNAYALAKLPADEMAEFLDSAITKNPSEFVPEINKRVKELNEAKRQGKDAAPPEFQPVMHMQKLGTIKEELNDGKICKELCKGLKTPDEGFKMALNWILHIDPRSLKVQQAEYDERQRLKEENRKKREAEKAKKAAEKKKAEAEEAAKAAVAAEKK